MYSAPFKSEFALFQDIASCASLWGVNCTTMCDPGFKRNNIIEKEKSVVRKNH